MGKVVKVASKKPNDSFLRDTVARAQKRLRKKAKGKANRLIAAQKVKSAVDIKQKRIEARRRRREKYHKEAGVLYLSHIPYGFFEEEIGRFFSQFGTVRTVRLVRSTISGRSKGYAFIVFRFNEVAQIAAETANNYLMGKRILKARVLPPDEVKAKWFYHHTVDHIASTLASRRRKKNSRSINRRLTPKEGLKRLKTQKKTLERMLKNLHEKGIDFKCNALSSP